jgi:NitT/TauT family transport system substrate-binding protein
MGPEALIKSLIEEQIDAEGNFYGSLAPSVWAQGLELNTMLYADHGVQIYGLGLATRPKVMKEQPELCAKFVEGVMEAMAWTYLNPEQAVDIHLEMVKEFRGSPTNRDVIKHGQGVRTAMALVPEFEKQGLGAFDAAMVQRTRETVMTYMGAKDVPAADQLFTNAFAGKTRLTAAQWAQVRDSVKRYVPARA